VNSLEEPANLVLQSVAAGAVWSCEASQHPTNNNSQHNRHLFITALHVMQTRYSEENSVRPSVCLSLSVRPSHAWSLAKREERLVQIFIPYERTFSL